jgi:hypothetical protein
LTHTRADEAQAREALGRLLLDGRVMREGNGDDAPLRSASFVISPGAAQGWEAAVFDHFQALATAVAAKVRARSSGAAAADVGGTTLHFGIQPGHPYEERVVGLLARIRAELDAFWKEVAAYNREHPIPDDLATRVTFYFGQVVTRPGEGELPPVAPNEEEKSS